MKQHHGLPDVEAPAAWLGSRAPSMKNGTPSLGRVSRLPPPARAARSASRALCWEP